MIKSERDNIFEKYQAVFCFTSLAGFPQTAVPDGTDLLTIDPGHTTTSSPIITPLQITLRAPIETLLPMFTRHWCLFSNGSTLSGLSE